MKTPGDIKLNLINAGGDYQHVNYINKLADCYKNIALAYGIARETEKDDNCAQMRQAMSMRVGDRGNLLHIALYTDVGAPLITGGDSFIVDAFIGSNKNNACPIILIRNRNNDKTSYFIWHLDYSRISDELSGEVKQYLPTYFNELNNKFPDVSMQHIFDDKNSDILVTNQRLLSQARLNCAATANILPLPEGLCIKSWGVEGSVRSYSMAYFPRKDFLLLSGEGGGGVNYFWAMKDPFSAEKKWIQLIDCDSLINYLKSDSKMTDECISNLISGLYDMKLKNQSANSVGTHSPVLQSQAGPAAGEDDQQLQTHTQNKPNSPGNNSSS